MAERTYGKNQRAGTETAWNNIRRELESGEKDKAWARTKLNKYPYMEEDQPELFAELKALTGSTERKPKAEKVKKERNLAAGGEEDELLLLRTANPKSGKKKKKNRVADKNDEDAMLGKALGYTMVVTDISDPENSEVTEAKIDDLLDIQHLIKTYNEVKESDRTGKDIRFFKLVNKKGNKRPDWDQIEERKFAAAMLAFEQFEEHEEE